MSRQYLPDIDAAVKATFVRVLGPTPLDPEDSRIGRALCWFVVLALVVPLALAIGGLGAGLVLTPIFGLLWLGAETLALYAAGVLIGLILVTLFVSTVVLFQRV